MTKRDFFIITIKLFGLYTLLTFLFSIIPSVYSLSAFSERFDFRYFLLVGLVFVVIVSLFLLLIFNADKVVKLLKLEKGFDDDYIKLGKLTSRQIAKIGIVFIGGFLLIESLATFLIHTLYLFKREMETNELGISYMPNQNYEWIISGVKTIIGFLLLTNYKSLSKFLDKSDKSD